MNTLPQRPIRSRSLRVTATTATLLILLSSTVMPAPAGIVADTLYFESRGETIYGQVAVASVIWNRSQRTGKSFRFVCLKRKQFSCWNKTHDRSPRPMNALERTLLRRFELIERDMNNGTFKPSGAWSHYFNPQKASPSWGSGMTNKKTIGRHLFGNTK